MITKRIIPCLDIRDGQVVKGVNFAGVRAVGDPVELARRYQAAVQYDESAQAPYFYYADGRGTEHVVWFEDARSIAATALNGGVLTGADELPAPPADPAEEPFAYDDTPYKARVYFGVGKPDPDAQLVFGPNIADWPAFAALKQDVLIGVASALNDAVTTTD